MTLRLRHTCGVVRVHPAWACGEAVDWLPARAVSKARPRGPSGLRAGTVSRVVSGAQLH
jgi:hypothetical protein